MIKRETLNAGDPGDGNFGADHHDDATALLLAGVSLCGALSYAITLGVPWHISGRPAGLERTVFDRLAPVIGRLSAAKR